jgi:hypothetical protein
VYVLCLIKNNNNSNKYFYDRNFTAYGDEFGKSGEKTLNNATYNIE